MDKKPYEDLGTCVCDQEEASGTVLRNVRRTAWVKFFELLVCVNNLGIHESTYRAKIAATRAIATSSHNKRMLPPTRSGDQAFRKEDRMLLPPGEESESDSKSEEA